MFQEAGPRATYQPATTLQVLPKPVTHNLTYHWAMATDQRLAYRIWALSPQATLERAAWGTARRIALP